MLNKQEMQDNLIYPQEEGQERYATLPMIAIRGVVVFPAMSLHFDIGREK